MFASQRRCPLALIRRQKRGFVHALVRVQKNFKKYRSRCLAGSFSSPLSLCEGLLQVGCEVFILGCYMSGDGKVSPCSASHSARQDLRNRSVLRSEPAFLISAIAVRWPQVNPRNVAISSQPWSSFVLRLSCLLCRHVRDAHAAISVDGITLRRHQASTGSICHHLFPTRSAMRCAAWARSLSASMT